MNRKQIALSLALVLGASGAAFAQAKTDNAMTEAAIRAKLATQGYTNVHDLKFDDGMWHADADSANGDGVDLRIDPESGKAYPDENKISRLSEDAVTAKLATAGYTNIHDVDFDDGMWTAKADDKTGKDVKLKIDPASGKVVGTDD